MTSPKSVSRLGSLLDPRARAIYLSFAADTLLHLSRSWYCRYSQAISNHCQVPLTVTDGIDMGKHKKVKKNKIDTRHNTFNW